MLTHHRTIWSVGLLFQIEESRLSRRHSEPASAGDESLFDAKKERFLVASLLGMTASTGGGNF
jgi:hypothetical protein